MARAHKRARQARQAGGEEAVIVAFDSLQVVLGRRHIRIVVK